MNLQEVENNYELDKVKVKDLHIWPIIRFYVSAFLISKNTGFDVNRRTRDKKKLIITFFSSLTSLSKLNRKKIDYLFFNNTDKRNYIVDDKKFDIFFDKIADELGQEKCFFIEWSIDQSLNKSETYSENVISDLLFKLIIKLWSFLMHLKITNEGVISKLFEDLKIDLDSKKLIKEKIAEYKFYRLLFKIIKPKSIFILSSYTKMSIVLAAKKENIKVFEAQHGYIGCTHLSYNVNKISERYYPDYLLSYGNFEKENLPESFIYSKNQIIPVGNLSLEDTHNNFEDFELQELREKYDKIFCISLQMIHEDQFLKWVIKQATTYKDSLFIIKPRDFNHLNYNDYLILPNLVILKKYSIYQLLKYSDYHVTIYSTTAIEASFFGAINIFYNINDLSNKYFSDITFPSITINNDDDISPNELVNINPNFKNGYFVKGYFENIRDFVTELKNGTYY